MLRILMDHDQKSAPADCKAAAAVATGMGVIADRTAKTFAVPTAETASNIYVVNKERIPQGIYAAQTNFSDYFEQFNDVAKDEYAPLYNFDFGEKFAVDAYDQAITESDVGKRLAVGTDGKWKVATVATVASKYKFGGFYQDVNHKLIAIEVCDDAVAN